jgi:lipopolysaccharide/colanic/teichoic acid biosynthesis glycosyltransferase
MLKRTFDFVFALFALLFTLPIMGVSLLMVYLEDGAPVIFRQKRVGKDEQLFDMFKIRTMVKNAEQLRGQAERRDGNGNLIHKTKDDPRITRVGRLLRRFSLDELPQLYNVLIGTMSLVGPRPEIPYLVEMYEPWQRKRFDVLPGITGWWQVNSRSDKPMYLHIEDDLYYIQNYSIWLDLKIILRTIWVVLIGKGAY